MYIVLVHQQFSTNDRLYKYIYSGEFRGGGRGERAPQVPDFQKREKKFKVGSFFFFMRKLYDTEYSKSITTKWKKKEPSMYSLWQK